MRHVELLEELEPGERRHGAVEPVPRQHEALQRVEPRDVVGDAAVEVVGAEVELLQRLEPAELGARKRSPCADADEREPRQRREPGERGEERLGGEGGRERGAPRRVRVAVAPDRERRDLAALARHGEGWSRRQSAGVRRPAQRLESGWVEQQAAHTEESLGLRRRQRLRLRLRGRQGGNAGGGAGEQEEEEEQDGGGVRRGRRGESHRGVGLTVRQLARRPWTGVAGNVEARDGGRERKGSLVSGGRRRRGRQAVEWRSRHG